MTSDEYGAWRTSPFLAEQLVGDDAVSLVVVRGADPEIIDPGALPVVVAWVGDVLGGDGPVAADLVVSSNAIDALASTIARFPIAACSLTVLLRSQVGVGTEAGLAAESAVYSMLQSGPEFTEWRAERPAAQPAEAGTVVDVERDGDTLCITLDRPRRHNAFSTAMRDQLIEALSVAVVDDSIRHVTLAGRGPSFCSGGDLDEFGSRPDPATAHLTRLAHSPARLIDQLSERATVHIHGATMGGGIEMAAFARHVVADPATRIGLPEVSLGLIPGAGGTVSITRRCGRQRTAALALTGTDIDAVTAQQWGLVDQISSR